MPANELLQGEFAKEFLNWVVSQTVIVGALAWFMKVIIQRTVDSAISSSFSKNLESYRDALSRASAARKLMLDREMEFYAEFDDHLATLIPLLFDLKSSVEEEQFTVYQKNCYKVYLETILELKRLVLTYEPYIDRGFYNAALELVVEMGSEASDWYAMAELLSSGNPVVDETKVKASELVDRLLWKIAKVRHRQITYLKQLSSNESSKS